MSKVFVSVTMSLDGFLAPSEPTSEAGRAAWMKQWMALQHYALQQKFLREKLKLGEGGETGPDNRYLEQTFQRTGASIMGKRMFDAGEHAWPEEAPFETPVYVVTHTVRAPWPRKGGTTFHFVNDGIESALRQARAAAGDRDVRIAGGAHAIVQFLNAGLVDQLEIALSPVFLGAGIRLLDGIDAGRVGLELAPATHSPLVTHLAYTVRRL